MIGVTAPWKYHLLVFSDRTLVSRIAPISSRVDPRKLALANLVISLGPKSVVLIILERISVNSWGSCRASRRSNYNIMICSTMNFCDFGVQKSKNHLRCRNDIFLQLIIIKIWLFISVFCSIVWLNIHIRHGLLLPTKLSPIISSHGIYKATGSQE